MPDLMAAHRYWRVSVTATGGTTWCTVGEIAFLDAQGNAISTANGTPIASSSVDWFTPDKAFDGSLVYDTGSWSSAGDIPQWCGFDFGAGNAQDVLAVVITNTDASYTPSEHPVAGSIDYSDDGASWTTVATFSGRDTAANLATTYPTVPSLISSVLADDQVTISAHHVPPISAHLQIVLEDDAAHLVGHQIPSISASLATGLDTDHAKLVGQFIPLRQVNLSAILSDDVSCIRAGTFAPAISSEEPVTITFPRLLSDPLPLRRTTELAQFRDDALIPWIYGRLSIKPIALDADGLEWLIADHAIASIDAVTLGGVATSGWQLINRLDDTGHAIATLRLTQPPKNGAAVVVRLAGKRHPQTGILLEHPADIVRDLLAECGWTLSPADLDILRDDYPDLAIAGLVGEARPLRDAIGEIMQSIGAIWSGSPLKARKRGIVSNPIAVLSAYEMEKPSATAKSTNLATLLRVTYDQNPATGMPASALTLHAPDLINEIGSIAVDLALPWLRTSRDALAVATEALQRLSRPQWSISDSIDAQYGQDCEPGDVFTIDHPWLPGGQAELQSTDYDPDRGRLVITLNLAAGEIPHVELLNRSVAINAAATDPLKITYTNGVATFNITDDSGVPIAGAAVTLDGQTTHQTDRFGQVQFKTARGAHTLEVSASGYAPFELTLTV
ncbi:carboxypeptidase regulatory-like domain-containing protein [Halothiobacillus diazotrophicus]|nr:carboxypeptidase regulatory-like domain-containing protein [Halothiobacillus diazotrophicus]